MLHNFIRTHQLYDDDFDDVQQNNDVPDDDDVEEVEAFGNANQLNAWRNGIADAMWEDYLNHVNANQVWYYNNALFILQLKVDQV